MTEKQEKYMLPGSVILGALLISASIIYSSGGFAVLTAPKGSTVANAQAAGGDTGGTTAVHERADAPVLGSKDAPVTMEEFADFQCPFCQSFFQNSLPTIIQKYVNTGKVKIVFRYFPLPFHVNAEISAVAAECANVQGKFWEYHDILYKDSQADGTGLDKASLESYATQVGLNTAKFNQCVESKATLSTVQSDTKDGTAAGVQGTPTFYINGVQLVGAQPVSAFESALDAALKK